MKSVADSVGDLAFVRLLNIFLGSLTNSPTVRLSIQLYNYIDGKLLRLLAIISPSLARSEICLRRPMIHFA